MRRDAMVPVSSVPALRSAPRKAVRPENRLRNDKQGSLISPRRRERMVPVPSVPALFVKANCCALTCPELLRDFVIPTGVGAKRDCGV